MRLGLDPIYVRCFWIISGRSSSQDSYTHLVSQTKTLSDTIRIFRVKEFISLLSFGSIMKWANLLQLFPGFVFSQEIGHLLLNIFFRFLQRSYCAQHSSGWVRTRSAFHSCWWESLHEKLQVSVHSIRVCSLGTLVKLSQILACNSVIELPGAEANCI